jgi:hypothetical protein
MEDMNFCPACGKNVEPGTPYCPACGARLNDPISEKRETQANDQAEKKMGSDRTVIAAVLMLVYSVPLAIFGAYMFADAGGLAHEVFTSPSLASSVDQLIALGYDEAWLASMFEITAILMILSGCVGIVAAILALTKKFWILTIILCIVSAVTGVVTLFGLVLGLIAFWMLYKAKPVFSS